MGNLNESGFQNEGEHPFQQLDLNQKDIHEVVMGQLQEFLVLLQEGKWKGSSLTDPAVQNEMSNSFILTVCMEESLQRSLDKKMKSFEIPNYTQVVRNECACLCR